MSTSARLDEVHARIAAAAAGAGRAAEEVQLVAVAKTATAETLREAWAAGQRSFGHNRLQHLEEHRAVLPEAVWHMIGPLQGKKVRKALHAADWVETVGDEKTAERIARVLAEDGLAPQRVLLQVNLLPEDGRYGCPLPGAADGSAAGGEACSAELRALAAEAGALEGLDLRGLMTIAPPAWEQAALHRGFARLREAAAVLAAEGLLPPHPELSMGMSGDYEIAVAEGATLVRVGRAIFPSADA